MRLLDRIDEWGRTGAERVAHRTAGVSLTWAQLIGRSDSLAGAISHAGLRPSSPIVLRGHKEPEMLVGILGCAKAGHPYVPVDISTPETRAEQIIAASEAELVLTPEVIRELVARGDSRIALAIAPSAPLYVMFTSGSTGEPKGVVVTHGCLDAFVGWMLDEQCFTFGRELFLNQAIFAFDLSVMDTWCCLATGGTLVSLTADDLGDFRRLFATLATSGITTWVSTPAFAQLCLAERGFDQGMLPQLHRFLFCGDVLTPNAAGQLLDRFHDAEVWNTYGPTEATVATTSVRVDRALLHRYPQLPIGIAMPGTSVVVEDEAGRPVSDGSRGELVIVGPNVSPGYLGRPDLTSQSFFVRDGRRGYRTGDWGTVRDGLLFFDGRKDDQVKIAGHRIEVGDVETHLASLSSVRGAAVIPSLVDGRPDALHAFVVLTQRFSDSDLAVSTAISRELAALIPAYMLPRRIHILAQFPLTANGKIDRRALASMTA